MNKIKLGSLFDGIGGFPLAATRLGMTPVWASEIEPAPISITKRHFPGMKHLGDITKINGAEIEPVDIITFGSPCQDLSVAGKRAGIDGARSGLFMEAVRIIKEMRRKTNGSHPTFAVWENVPGAFSSNNGEDFRTVLEALAKIKDCDISIPRSTRKGRKWLDAGAMVGCGWSISWRCLDAQFWGVPQRRRRIFLVADFREDRAPEILFKREGLSRHLTPGGAQRQETTGDVGEGVTAAGFNGWRGVTGSIAYSEESCPTIQSTKPPNVLQSVAFMGGQGAKTRSIAYAEELSPTLKATASGTDAVPSIVTYDARGNGDGQVESTLTGDHQNRVTDYTALAIDCRNHKASDVSGQSLSYINPVILPIHDKATRYKGGGPTRNDDGAGNGLGVGNPGDPMPTLDTSSRHSVLCVATGQANAEILHDICPTILSRSCERPYVARSGHIVRRLTPLECERLQDYPDGWTESGHDGKPISDTQRYMVLGNSIAVVCAEYVLDGIQLVLQERIAA